MDADRDADDEESGSFEFQAIEAEAGRRMRVERERAGLTAEALADRMGCTAKQVYRLETVERRMSVLWVMRVAEALDIPPARLLPWDGDLPASKVGRLGQLEDLVHRLRTMMLARDAVGSDDARAMLDREISKALFEV